MNAYVTDAKRGKRVRASHDWLWFYVHVIGRKSGTSSLTQSFSVVINRIKSNANVYYVATENNLTALIALTLDELFLIYVSLVLCFFTKPTLILWSIAFSYSLSFRSP